MTAIKDGIKDVIDLNTILTQTATAMNTTVDKLGALTTGAQQMSQAMGANINDVLAIMHVYANVNETADSIMKKTKADVILSNLTGMSGQETTNSLQAIQQQFNLTDDQLMHVDDSLTKIASNLRMNYQDAITQIANGVKTAGAMASQAGLSFETFSGIIASTAETSRRSGEEIANMYKMVTARITNISSPDVEITGVDKSKAATALASVNIDVLDKTTHQLRNEGDILSDLSKKWNTLSIDTKAYLSESIAATRQYSLFESMMNSFTKAQDLATQALNSNGYALKQQETYMQSNESKLKTLSSEITTMWQNTISSQGINVLLSGITKLVEVFGNLPMIVSLATTALLVFKGEAILSTVLSISALTTSLMADSAALGAWGTAVFGATMLSNAFNAVLSANPLGVYAVAITAVVVGLSLLSNASENARKAEEQRKQEEEQLVSTLDDQITKIKEQQKSLDELGKSYIDLSNNLNQSAEDHQKFLDVQNQISALYPDLIDHYDTEGNAHIKNAQAIDEEVKKLKELQSEKEKDKRDYYADNLKAEKDAIQSNKVTIAEFEKDIANINSKKADKNGNIWNSTGTNKLNKEDALKEDREGIVKFREEIDASQKKIDEFTTGIKNGINGINNLDGVSSKIADDLANGITKQLQDGKISVEDYAKSYDKIILSINKIDLQKQFEDYANLNTQFQAGNIKIDVVDKAYKNLYDTLLKLGVTAKDIPLFLQQASKEITGTVDDQLKDIVSLKDAYSTLSSAVDEYNKSGYISIDTLNKLLENDGEYLQYLSIVNGKLVMNKDAMVLAAKADIDKAIAQKYVEQTSIVQTLIDQATKAENLATSTNKAASATMDLATAQTALNTALTQAGKLKIDPTKDSSYIQNQKEIDLLNKVKSGLGKGSLGDTSSGSKSSYTPQTQQQALKSLLDDNKISLQTYYNNLLTLEKSQYSDYAGKSNSQLMAMLKSKNEDVAKRTQDYLSLDSDIKSTKTTIDTNAQKAIDDKFNSSFNDLSSKYSHNKISIDSYISSLENLKKTIKGLTTDELQKLNDEIDKTKADQIALSTDNVKNKYQSQIDSIQNLIDKNNELMKNASATDISKYTKENNNYLSQQQDILNKEADALRDVRSQLNPLSDDYKNLTTVIDGLSNKWQQLESIQKQTALDLANQILEAEKSIEQTTLDTQQTQLDSFKILHQTIIDGLNAQIQALDDQSAAETRVTDNAQKLLDIQNAQLDVQKAQDALTNAQNEKIAKIFHADANGGLGGFIFEADPHAVQTAQDNLNSATDKMQQVQKDYSSWLKNNDIADKKAALQRQIDSENALIKVQEDAMTKSQKIFDDEWKNINSMGEIYLKTFGDNIDAAVSIMSDKLATLQAQLTSALNVKLPSTLPTNTNTYPTGGSNLQPVLTNSSMLDIINNTPVAPPPDHLIPISQTETDSLQRGDIFAETGHYASGTPDAQQLSVVGEKGRELRVLNPNGKDSIIPNGITEKLMSFAQNPMNFMSNFMANTPKFSFAGNTSTNNVQPIHIANLNIEAPKDGSVATFINNLKRML